MQNFMVLRQIRAGALAVARNGRLILARGYTNDASLPLTQPTSRFRVASLSKPITAAAVAHLMERGRLSYIDRLLDRYPLTTLSGAPLPAGYDRITVHNLAQHRAGWADDWTFQDRYIHDHYPYSLPISRATAIRYAAQQPLAHTPGTTEDYANYGYWLLGEIVTRASGVPYATYVRDNLLTPMGITRTEPATTFPRADLPDEVVYFPLERTAESVFDNAGTLVSPPYGGFNVENLLAGGGWLSTVVDYVRFAQIFDGMAPVLSDWMINFVFGTPENYDGSDRWYGYGWVMDRAEDGTITTRHGGAMRGTRTIVTRRADGITWAAFFNKWIPDEEVGDGQPHYRYEDIAVPLGAAADAVNSWPSSSVDYFPNYIPNYVPYYP